MESSKKELEVDLKFSIFTNNIPQIKYLLEKEVDPNCQDDYGVPLINLICSMKNINYSILNIFLQYKADPNQQDRSNAKNALHSLFINENVEFRVLSLLLKHNADPNLKDKDNRSCIYYASNNKLIPFEIIESLIENGCSCYDDGLLGSAKRGDINFIKYFIEKGAKNFQQGK